MKISGIIKDSFQQYDNQQSLVLFSYNCNFKCKQCHNYNQVTDVNNIIGDAKDIIDSNLNAMHTAVVFLGGQPTIYNQLYDLCEYVKKDKKLKTKIYTNGTNYNLIKKIVENGLLDSISIDLKCLSNTTEVLGVNISGDEYLNNIDKLIELFKEHNNICVQFRTTKWECILHQLDKIEKYVINKQLPTNFKHIIQRKI